MLFNLNSGYGRSQAAGLPFTTGKVFVVASSTAAGIQILNQLYVPDVEGTPRIFSTITSALAQCVTGRGDAIVLHPAFTTALTAAELLSAETKGVVFVQAGKCRDGIYFENRATAALPATTQAPIFTVTGKIKLISIIGEVTTVIQTQANNTKIVANPTVGADVDLCAVLSTTAAAVGSQFSITGTLADAMVKTVSGAGVFQAAPLIILPGTIDLSTAATNTGSVKWNVLYQPIDPGACVFAA